MTPVDTGPPPVRRRNPLAPLALLVAVAAAAMIALAGPGTARGWWHFRTGFKLMEYGAKAGIAAVVLAVVALLMTRRFRRGTALAVLALLLGAGAFFFPWNLRRTARQFPPIHDITTDTENPPSLVAVRPIREATGATNTWTYEGDSIAALQRQAYPDIQPVMLAMAPDSAWAVAYQAARDMGWEIVEVDRGQGRIEATHTTRWFGFKDDVVIRVQPASGITRVDVRSVSRVGRGDVGMNAKRIRAYVEKLKEVGKVREGDA